MRQRWTSSLRITAALVALASTAAPVRALTIVEAARAQVGRTLVYDPAYQKLSFPNGDVPEDRGVCTDVVIRAMRASLGYDLQAQLNADIRSARDAYPKAWGAVGPDPSIDHRRVPNLQAFFRRKGWERPVGKAPGDYAPGDLVTQMLPGNLPHIAVVSDRTSSGRPLMIHNIGAGAREEDTLFTYPITGHYRIPPQP